MSLPEAPSPRQLPYALITGAIVVAALYFGQDLFIPLALAVLLGFVLDPLVSRLKRWGLPRALAVALVVSLTLALLVGAGAFVASQLRSLGSDLPTYQTNITHKLKGMRQSLQQPSSGMLASLTRLFGTVESELQAAQRPRPPLNSAQAPKRELNRVEVVQAPPTPIERVQGWLEQMSSPAATAGIVLVFMVLILLDRTELRDRLLRLLGNDLHRNTQALDEVGDRVSRYLTMQLMVNVAYGVPMALGLWLLGVPGAWLWGLLSGLLRFVPYVGPMLAAVFPLTLAFAVDPGWNLVLWTLALIVALEVISNNVIEPWLYGSSTGMSAISLMLAATFWTSLWGPVGLVLSTPLTASLLVLSRHVAPLRFLDILLGSSPALDAPAKLYQRLLAGNLDEALGLAAQHVEANSLQHFYGHVGLPMLQHLHRTPSVGAGDNALGDHQTPRTNVLRGMQHLMAELRDMGFDAEAEPAQTSAASQPGRAQPAIVMGARDGVDELAADMAVHALQSLGLNARVWDRQPLTGEGMAKLTQAPEAAAIYLVYTAPDWGTHAKVLCRRLKRQWPNVPVVLAAWQTAAHAEASFADGVVNDLQGLVADATQRLPKEA